MEKSTEKFTRHPTEKQLSLWDYEGGNISLIEDKVELIDGHICVTPEEKIRAKVSKLWNEIKGRFNH